MPARHLLIAAAAALAAGLGLAGGASAQTPAPAAGDPDAGAESYTTECKVCHAGGIGPVLRGVLNRPVASVAGYAYSDALKGKSALTWTEANLDAFLSGPATFAPGTLMTKSIADAQARADIIAYLASLPPPK